jgi:hypothetical protein
MLYRSNKLAEALLAMLVVVVFVAYLLWFR